MIEATLTPPDEPPVTGRSWELDLLMSRVELVRYAASSVATIEGGAGLGKSRLLDALVERCATFGLWGNVWRATLTPGVQVNATATIRALQPLSNPARNLSRLSLDDSYRDEQAIAAVLVRRIERLCAERQQRELIVAIDDAHWIDAVSAAVLRRLVIQSHLHVCLVLAMRSNAVIGNDAVASLFSLRETTRVSLSPMSDDDIAEILAQTLEGRQPPSDWLRWCVKEAGGNPLYAKSLARGLSDDRRGGAGRRESPMATGDFRALSYGTEIYQRRVASLSPAQLKALVVMAVVGKTVTTSRIAALTGTALEETRALLEISFRDGLVEQHGDDSWSFSHPLLPGVALATVPEPVVRELRLRYVDLARFDESVSPIERAQQLKAAGLRDEAIQIYIAEATKAANLGAHREAAELFRRADNAAKTEREKQLLIENDARLIRIRSLFAISKLEEAAELIAGEFVYRDRHRARLVWDWVRSGFSKRTRAELLEETRALSVLSRHSVELGFFQNRVPSVLIYSLRSVLETHWAGELSDSGLGLAHSGVVTTLMGMAGVGDWLSRRARKAILEAWNIPSLVEYALLDNVRLSHAGEFQKIEAGTSVALEWFEMHDDPVRYEMLIALRALSHLLRGDVVTAERWHQRCLESTRSSGSLQTGVWALSTIIYCRVFQGLPCEEYVDELRRLLNQTISVADRIYAEGAVVLWLSATGDESCWDSLIEQVRRYPVGPYYLLVPIDLCLSKAIERVRKAPESERNARAAEAWGLLASVFPNVVANGPSVVPFAVRAAELLAVLGHARSSHTLASFARRRAARHDMQLHELLAEFCEATTDPARKHRIINEIKVSLGSVWHASQIEASLATEDPST